MLFLLMDNTTDILATLVGFKTISRDANEALITYAAQRLQAAGGAVRVLAGTKPGQYNLLASFGPLGDGGVILSGHADVVPVAGQDWSRDPFTLRAAQGRLYARGAVDMKGFLASALALAGRLPQLARPLHIAISHDEEIGCVGVRSMLATLATEGFKAAGCIVGEPTEMRVATGHKGKIAGCICCRGQAAHSANPGLGSNAIYLAADMVGELRGLQQFLREHGAYDEAYEVPYTTLHVGTVKGGTALNIVPDVCEMAMEIRYLPGDSPSWLLEQLRAAGAKLAAAETQRGRFAAVEISETNEYPGLETPEDDGLVALAQAAGGGDVYKAGFGTEAGLFAQRLGFPAIVCGPGSIDRAHKPDEFITGEELARCDAFLDKIAASLV